MRRPSPWPAPRLAGGALVVLLLLACSPGPTSTAPAPAAPAAAPAGASSGAAGGQSGGAASGPAPLIRTRSAYTSIVGSAAPWWVALEAGYFREQGLDVELLRVDPGAPQVAAMRNGELDVVFGGGPGLLVGYLQGLETLLVGATSNTLDAVVFTRPEIQSVEGLRGKTIGVTRLKSVSDVGARLGFQRVGLQPDVDVFTRGTGGYAESMAAMEAGVLDGASLSVELAVEARQRGYHELMDLATLGIPFVTGGIGATRQLANDRPDLVDRYLRALAQAVSRLKTDREFGMQVYGKYGKLDSPELLGAVIDYYRPQLMSDLYPEPQAVQNMLDVEEHPAAATTRPADAVDYRFVERLRQSGFLDTLPKGS